NRFHRMPGVGADGESITGVGDEAHLRMLVEAAVRLALVEDRADVADAVVRRQIELYGDAFPMRIGVRRDAVAGDIAGEDRHGVQPGAVEAVAETPPQARRQL